MLPEQHLRAWGAPLAPRSRGGAAELHLLPPLPSLDPQMLRGSDSHPTRAPESHVGPPERPLSRHSIPGAPPVRRSNIVHSSIVTASSVHTNELCLRRIWCAQTDRPAPSAWAPGPQRPETEDGAAAPAGVARQPAAPGKPAAPGDDATSPRPHLDLPPRGRRMPLGGGQTEAGLGQWATPLRGAGLCYQGRAPAGSPRRRPRAGRRGRRGRGSRGGSHVGAGARRLAGGTGGVRRGRAGSEPPAYPGCAARAWHSLRHKPPLD